MVILGPFHDAEGEHRGVHGVLLAAGAGRRAGGPKALRVHPDGTSWLLRSVTVLLEGGCQSVVVVLGCGADAARDLLAGSVFGENPNVTVQVARDWQDGMGASLRAGLLAARPAASRAVVVHLVDLPDVTAAVLNRLLRRGPADTGVLRRATFDGRPGHPVLIGVDHLQPIITDLAADHGAREYLARHGVEGVECADLATGQDRDQ